MTAAPFSWMAAQLFDGVGRVRNALYDREILRSHKLPLQVISIGNLSVGGTGKTPVTEFLLDLLKERQVPVAVLSRGYGGTTRTVTRVPAEGDSARLSHLYGDEPTWLARMHPDIPVYVGRNRVVAGQHILAHEKISSLLLDDAFQHRRLRRDLDLLLIDTIERPDRQRLLPSGRLREGWYAARRASAVILNKTNLSTSEQLSAWREFLRLQLGPEVPLWEFQYEIAGLQEFKSGRMLRPAELSGGEVVLLSAIAKPQVFEHTVRTQLGVSVKAHHHFRDHHRFTKADLAEISVAEPHWILTTQKDATKLNPAWLDRVLVTQLKVTCSPQTKEQIFEMVCPKTP